MAMRSPSAGLILRDGIGRLRVRSIRSSKGHSWYWLNAEAPDARRKMPATGQNITVCNSPVARTIAVKAERVTAMDTGNRVRMKMSFKLEECTRKEFKLYVVDEDEAFPVTLNFLNILKF
jgi:hypothetical protein